MRRLTILWALIRTYWHCFWRPSRAVVTVHEHGRIVVVFAMKIMDGSTARVFYYESEEP